MKKWNIKEIHEKTEMYLKEIEMIETRMNNADEKEIEEIKDELNKLEENIKTIKSEIGITIDIMMIIGKYFEENEDYINVMKISKRYHDLTQMYHFNPISDPTIFENMETQYFYSSDDMNRRKEGMNRYIFV